LSAQPSPSLISLRPSPHATTSPLTPPLPSRHLSPHAPSPLTPHAPSPLTPPPLPLTPPPLPSRHHLSPHAPPLPSRHHLSPHATPLLPHATTSPLTPTTSPSRHTSPPHATTSPLTPSTSPLTPPLPSVHFFITQSSSSLLTSSPSHTYFHVVLHPFPHTSPQFSFLLICPPASFFPSIPFTNCHLA
ncbi:hypothetical protein Pcinc_037447, partial [Petrolisthes cinctipes]